MSNPKLMKPSAIRLDSCQKFVGKSGPLLRRRIPESGQRDIRLHNMLSLKPRADRHEFGKAAQQQTRGYEQDHRERNFSCRQETARTPPVAAFAGAPPAFAEARLQIGVRREPGRSQTKRAACDGGKEKRKSQDIPVNSNGIHSRQILRKE